MCSFSKLQLDNMSKIGFQLFYYSCYVYHIVAYVEEPLTYQYGEMLRNNVAV